MIDTYPSTRIYTERVSCGQLSDEDWRLIADLVRPNSGRGRMGRPVKNDRRDVVNAILYVQGTHCRWRALPPGYPNWSSVHGYYRVWSRDGTWREVARRLSRAHQRH
ncbi:MAG: transposase [Acidimicrobiales bacterium]